MVSYAINPDKDDYGMDFVCSSLWGTVDNMTLPDTIYKGVALCGWDEIGLWSIYSSEKNESVERSGTSNVERIFVEEEYFIGTRSAPKADDMKDNWIRYVGDCFLHWTFKTLKTKGLLRDGGLTEEDGHSAPGTVAPMARAETKIACPSDRDSWETHLQVSGLVV